MREEKEQNALKLQLESTEASIYVSGDSSGQFAKWEDPKSIQINTRVIALTACFAIVICYYGFCCGGLFVYKLRHRLPINQDQNLQAEVYENTQNIYHPNMNELVDMENEGPEGFSTKTSPMKN